MPVIFDYNSWALRFPEISNWVNATLATMYWQEATMLCDNTATSPISDVVQRAILLNLLTSHIAALNAPLGGQASPNLVGRISDATEGSVTVRAQMDMPPGSAQYYAQTKYGSQYWAATAQYRSARYIAAPVRNFQPYGSFLGQQ